MSPLERLIVALVPLEGEDALLPLNVLLPLYRGHLAKPALQLIELYEQDLGHAVSLIESLFDRKNMYWFDVSMHYNDQDLLHNDLCKRIDALAAAGEPTAVSLNVMAEWVGEEAASEWPFRIIVAMYLAAIDKHVAGQLPRLEPYMDEVAAMVEQGYPVAIQLP